MSIDINWDTVTQGPDGEALAETIRAFVHDRFQKVTLPRMIRSVKVHSFEFGNVAPEVELKDICDPLPDFYEGEDDEEESQLDGQSPTSHRDDLSPLGKDQQMHEHAHATSGAHGPDSPYNNRPYPGPRMMSLREQMVNPLLSRAGTPGILGGTSNLGYFHLPLSAGLSGTTTPLAAVAGAQYKNARHDRGSMQYPYSRTTSNLAQSPDYFDPNAHHRTTSFGSITPSSQPSSRPTSRYQQMDWADGSPDDRHSSTRNPSVNEQERSAEDIQLVFHVSYSGDVKLSLTAEILLDYPMPSFVGIPMQLNITGLTFDGVGILAYIKHKAHFCFLCREDAEALVGDAVSGAQQDEEANAPQSKQRLGALLEEIKVESEIGQREGGKQVLKNVGKVEKFVLEQVRKIFDDEFVYPSFWTFLV